MTASRNHRSPRPLLSDEDVLACAKRVVGRAKERRAWFIVVDEHDRQRPDPEWTELPKRVPHRYDRAVMGAMMCDAFREHPATSVIVVLERRGEPTLSTNDHAWIEMLHEASHDHGVPMRGMLVASDEGVRSLGYEDVA